MKRSASMDGCLDNLQLFFFRAIEIFYERLNGTAYKSFSSLDIFFTSKLFYTRLLVQN